MTPCCIERAQMPPLQVPLFRASPPLPTALSAHCTPPSAVAARQFQILPVSAASSSWSIIRIEPTFRLASAPFAGVVLPQFATVMLVVRAGRELLDTSQTFPSPPLT